MQLHKNHYYIENEIQNKDWNWNRKDDSDYWYIVARDPVLLVHSGDSVKEEWKGDSTVVNPTTPQTAPGGKNL
jgi:hypothetical protein